MKKPVAKKYQATKFKIKHRWARYAKVKAKILKRKLAPDLKKQLRASELDLARQDISSYWKNYRDVKYNIIHPSPFADFLFVKKQTGYHKEINGEMKFVLFSNTYQKIYKAKSKDFDTDKLDTIVPDLLNDPKVKGVLVVLKVTSSETENREFISGYITKTLYERLQQYDESVYDYVVHHFNPRTTREYNLQLIYLRVVYAKS